MKLPGATTKIAPNTACFWAELEAHWAARTRVWMSAARPATGERALWL